MPLNEVSGEPTLLDKVATSLLEEWEVWEGNKVNPSYVATFVDMAKRVIRDFEVKERG